MPWQHLQITTQSKFKLNEITSRSFLCSDTYFFRDRDSIKDQRHRNLVTLDFKRLQNSQEQVVADIGNDHGKIAELDQHKIIVHWKGSPETKIYCLWVTAELLEATIMPISVIT